MKINEIFYSLQGEGAYTGNAATFIRFSGCNLKCPFCDTEHQSSTEMSEDELVERVKAYPSPLVVLTGGEPTLQITKSLVDKLHDAGKYIAIETNGTKKITSGIDWVTVSPKSPYCGEKAKLLITEADELKVVFDGKTLFTDPTFGIKAARYFVQPCDTGDEKRNKEIINLCVEFVKNNPKWKLSLQTQKILGVR